MARKRRKGMQGRRVRGGKIWIARKGKEETMLDRGGRNGRKGRRRRRQDGRRGGGEGRKVGEGGDGRKIREGGGDRTGMRGDEGRKGGSWG
jgi:hypothetical protein